MKEAIEDLISNYEKKIKELKRLIITRAKGTFQDEVAKARLTAKRGTYEQAVGDLKQLLRDEQDAT